MRTAGGMGGEMRRGGGRGKGREGGGPVTWTHTLHNGTDLNALKRYGGGERTGYGGRGGGVGGRGGRKGSGTRKI